MKTLSIAAMAMATMTAGASGADAGWGVQFHYDAFEDKTYPMAAMQEQVEGTVFDSANLFLVCNGGAPAVIFQPERFAINFGNTVVTGKFRGAEGVQDFEFPLVEVPAFGNVQAATGADAEAILAIFSAASGPVPFQTDTKSGNFPIAGFEKVKAIMDAECAAL
jgi:hypothetical protein